jgi:hypothetical protein
MRLFAAAVFTACLTLFAANLPAAAQLSTPGSRNFEPPSSVPNYFSNEAGPFQGGAGAETTYSSSGPAVVSPYPPTQTAAVEPLRTAVRHVARANRRVRLARAHPRSGRHAARTRVAKAKVKVKVVRVAHAHAKLAGPKKSVTKLASAKKPATKAAGSKKPPAATKNRPGKEKRATHTASR